MHGASIAIGHDDISLWRACLRVALPATLSLVLALALLLALAFALPLPLALALALRQSGTTQCDREEDDEREGASHG
ncbi:MAG: hypothetical protein B7Y08_27205 [Rhodospirillales bacterium 24-66-33]|nr:MAG: hypothetical protein B7Y57_24910 [Rhodospirillales bacterium 35-66-84]OYZ91145.1 MAG: hypothetical protein B7Y08_27205 [Rhodospirillales bacterium 24-66-33]OZB22641.1 MAG: hypothetical protein B7X63_22250 [Rhodospirillales bacterium 39-66-50]